MQHISPFCFDFMLINNTFYIIHQIAAILKPFYGIWVCFKVPQLELI